MKKIKHQVTLKQSFLILLGVILIAISVHFFMAPSKLATGGASGLAIILSNLFGIDKGIILTILNILFFIAGFLFMGNSFGILTLIATMTLSLIVYLLDIFIPISEPIVPGLMINVIMSSIFLGSGVGIVLNQYASTGGTDIIAKIINKYLGVDLGKACLIVDFLITCGAGVTFGLEIAIYCLLGVIMNGIVIDYTINGLNSGKYLIINTNKSEEVIKHLHSINRTATLYETKGAYKNEKRIVLQTVVSNREFISIKSALKEIDPTVFLIITNAHQVIGSRWGKIDE